MTRLGQGLRSPVRTRAVRSLPLVLLSWMVWTLGVVCSPAATDSVWLGFDADLHTDFLRVTRPIALTIDDPGYELSIGQKLDLFEQTSRHYIGLVNLGNGISRLCAIPARSRKSGGTAWVTNERRIILGQDVETCEAKFTLRINELLPIMEETEDVYRVICERHGRQVVLDLDRSVKAVVREERAARRPESNRKPAEIGKDGSTMTAPKIAKMTTPTESVIQRRVRRKPKPEPDLKPETPVIPPSPGVDPDELEARLRKEILAEVMARVESNREERSDVPFEEPAGDAAGNVNESTPGDTVAESAPVDEMPPPDLVVVPSNSVSEAVEEIPTPVVVVRGEGMDAMTQMLPHVGGFVASVVSNTAGGGRGPARSMPALAEKNEGGFVSFLSGHALLFQILLGLCIVEGVLIVRMRRQEARTRQVGSSVLSVATFGESVAQGALEDALSGDCDLTGSLSKFPPEQVIQLLYASQETGTLWISYADGSRMHKLFFLDGQLIDAEAGSRRGEEVLHAVLAKPEGSFSFKREDVSSRARSFKGDTMSILLAVSREVDEQAQKKKIGT